MNATDKTFVLTDVLERARETAASELSSNELLVTCAFDGTVALWEEFIRRFRPVLSRAVSSVCRRYGVNPQHHGDLLQEVFLKLASNERKVLRRFVPSAPSSAFAFLRVVAVNACLDAIRAGRAGRKDDSDRAAIASDALEHVGHLDQPPAARMERDVLLRQVDDILRQNLKGPYAFRDRVIFWLYYRVGLGTASIAMISSLRLSPKGVESVVTRTTRMVREALSRQPDEGNRLRTAFKKGRR